MGKAAVRLFEVSYALSPFQQNVMPGLFKDIPVKLSKKISGNALSAAFLMVPLVGTVAYAENYKEQEKLDHRY
eukprot:CAMPEP_0118932210 /NCGR_PEP_ID=MMETSP1169-20130426/9488_1 /TAXON_ID=36882 /ORGANISM="Pyramimonas obovata, Strain CCMP722" /LENGTH=72 /DNA_ID=CAMNT_0006874833 /DNA_START=46 /DNA_END=264 /DNA_ORIENTATION=+